MEEADAADWLRNPARRELRAQTLRQQEGYATTLLLAETIEEDEEDGVEDAYRRFSRFER